MDISIVIPVYNKLELTVNCVESIFKAKSNCDFEIVISDDCSSDGTFDYCKNLANARKNVKYIKNVKNSGFAFTCNRGAETASGKYILFLNNDTVVTDFFLDNFLKTFDIFNNVGIVGAKLLYEDNTLQHAGVLIFPDKKVDHLFRYFPKDYNKACEFRILSAVTAACMLVKKELFFREGRFDERFLNGFEDLDLCFKIREAGFKIVYNPEVEIYHLESKTRDVFTETNDNALILTEKWGKKIQPDYWMFNEGFSFKINEEGIFYIVKNVIENAEKLSSNIDELQNIVKNDPLEFNAMKKLISLYSKKKDFKSAVKLAGDLFKFAPVSESLLILKDLFREIGGDLSDIEKYLTEKSKKISENKKKMRTVARKLFSEENHKTGIFYAEWLKNFIGDYSSYRLFMNYLEKIKDVDKMFYKIWEIYYDDTKNTLEQLSRERFSI